MLKDKVEIMQMTVVRLSKHPLYLAACILEVMWSLHFFHKTAAKKIRILHRHREPTVSLALSGSDYKQSGNRETCLYMIRIFLISPDSGTTSCASYLCCWLVFKWQPNFLTALYFCLRTCNKDGSYFYCLENFDEQAVTVSST